MGGQLRAVVRRFFVRCLIHQRIVIQRILLDGLNAEQVAAYSLLDELSNVLGIAQLFPVPYHNTGPGHRIRPSGVRILRHGEIGDENAVRLGGGFAFTLSRGAARGRAGRNRRGRAGRLSGALRGIGRGASSTARQDQRQQKE